MNTESLAFPLTQTKTEKGALRHVLRTGRGRTLQRFALKGNGDITCNGKPVRLTEAELASLNWRPLD
jgi:hypothetical protein